MYVRHKTVHVYGIDLIIMDQELREFESVQRRRKQAYQLVHASLDTLESCIIQMADYSDNSSKRKELLTVWKETSTKLSTEWKEGYALAAKLSKVLDKRFKSEGLNDVTASNNNSNIDIQKNSLHTTIVHHLYRQGRFDLANSLALESKCTIDENIIQGFHRLHEIVSSMKHHQNLSPAQIWALEHQDFLNQRDSSLAFQLCRLQYLHYCSLGKASDAIQFFKSRSDIFGEKYLKEIKRLTGCLSYINRLNESPYVDLFYPELPWQQVLQLFVKEYIAWMRLPCESPLACCLKIGMLALPKILKVSNLMKEKGIEWTTQNELPIELDVPDDARFHSVFSCPVLKEPSSVSNPPMMMPCGHVICKEALGKLSKGTSGKFKCPYCPGESTSALAQRVYI